jgi:LmbE family N-acetylglucosaminyl deacetylase
MPFLSAGQGRDHSALVAKVSWSVDPGERIVVVSPHLDDGVLSLGAAMAAWTRRGAQVALLTVFGCNPDSDAPAGGWDGRAGFGTEGEAARARREEDRRACAILGMAPRWLPFGSVDFERGGDEADVAAAVEGALDGAETVLLPGFPLNHPDHAWLVRALAGRGLGGGRVGLYAEQPYARRAGTAPRAPSWAEDAIGGRVSFAPVPSGVRERVAKWRAIRAYRTQLPLLAMKGSLRRGPHVWAWTPEQVAWPDGADRNRD